MKLSITIPAYNEEKRIGKKLETYSKYFKKLSKSKKLDYEIIIVINNTKDKTEEVVKKYQKKDKKIRCLNFKQGGKGFAIIEGFKDALKRKNDLIGFVDADMSTQAKEFAELAFNIGDYDASIASRYIDNAKIIPSLPLKRKITSRVFNFLVRSLFFMNYHDTQCGAKVFKREAIEKVLPLISITQWAIDVDLLYKLKKCNLRAKEIPTIWYDVEGSTLKLGKASTQMFFAVIQLRLIESRFSRFLKPIAYLTGLLWRALK